MQYAQYSRSDNIEPKTRKVNFPIPFSECIILDLRFVGESILPNRPGAIFKSPTRILKRKLRLIIGVALIFMILGIGNMLIGRSRATSYQTLLKQSLEIQINNSSSNSIDRIKARLDFYRIVELGGKCFLVVSGFLLLWYLLLLRDDEEPKT